MTIIGCHVQYMPDIWGIGGEGDSGQIFKSITFQVQLSCSHLILNSNVLIGFLNFLLWKQFRQKLPFHGKLCPIFLPNLSAFVVLSAIHKWPMRMRLFSLSLLTCLQLLQRSQFSQLQPSSQSFLAKSMHKKMAKKQLMRCWRLWELILTKSSDCRRSWTRCTSTSPGSTWWEPATSSSSPTPPSGLMSSRYNHPISTYIGLNNVLLNFCPIRICLKTAKRIVIFSGVPVHSSDSISEWESDPVEDRPQSFCKRLPGHRGRQGNEEVSGQLGKKENDRHVGIMFSGRRWVCRGRQSNHITTKAITDLR